MDTGNVAIQWEDLLFFLPILVVIYGVCIGLFKIFWSEKASLKMFIAGLTAKILGGVFITLIYMYYFRGGDTLNYYFFGAYMHDYLMTDFSEAWSSFSKMRDTSGELFNGEKIDYLRSPSTWLIVRLSALSMFFSFKSYLGSVALFSTISYLAIWKAYLKFLKFFPTMRWQLAIGFLFYPSVLVWGSGIFKDTVTLAALMVAFVATYEILFERKRIVLNSFLLLVSIFLMFVIKIYILIAFVVAFAAFAFFHQVGRIRDFKTKLFLSPLILAVTAGSMFYLVNYIGQNSERYAAEALLNSAVIQNAYLSGDAVGAGSAYSIGEIQPTLGSFAKVAPNAVIVTYFRPFPWEISSAAMVLAALESLLILLLTLYVFISTPLGKVIAVIRKNDVLIFCLLFCLIFALAVGIASGNFGSLVRYKIPCLPFYVTYLLAIHHLARQPNYKSVVSS